MATDASAWSGISLHDGDDFIRDFLERFGMEHAHLGNEKALVRGKELCRAGIADHSKAALLEIIIGKLHRPGVRIRLAGNLAENPVAAPGRCNHKRRTAFGLRQVRKREWNEDY